MIIKVKVLAKVVIRIENVLIHFIALSVKIVAMKYTASAKITTTATMIVMVWIWRARARGKNKEIYGETYIEIQMCA